MLYHPLGLGDHIVCNGLVREQCRRYDRVGLFCFPNNETSVSFLYRDLKNFRLHVIRSHKEARRFRFLNRFVFSEAHYDKILAIGSYDVESGIKYERQMYTFAELPLEALWDSFYVERDSERERSLSQKMHAEGRYVFLHDDARYPINPKKISSPLPMLRPDTNLTDNIFDYCGVLEHAEEIHVIDSSFMFLVDCLPYMNPRQRLFVHRYARENMEWNLPILKKNWQIIL